MLILTGMYAINSSITLPPSTFSGGSSGFVPYGGYTGTALNISATGDYTLGAIGGTVGGAIGSGFSVGINLTAGVSTLNIQQFNNCGVGVAFGAGAIDDSVGVVFASNVSRVFSFSGISTRQGHTLWCCFAVNCSYGLWVDGGTINIDASDCTFVSWDATGAVGSVFYNSGGGSPAAWISGGSYTVNTWVSSIGANYICKANVSGSGLAPASDPTHWQPAATLANWELRVSDWGGYTAASVGAFCSGSFEWCRFYLGATGNNYGAYWGLCNVTGGNGGNTYTTAFQGGWVTGGFGATWQSGSIASPFTAYSPQALYMNQTYCSGSLPSIGANTSFTTYVYSPFAYADSVSSVYRVNPMINPGLVPLSVRPTGNPCEIAVVWRNISGATISPGTPFAFQFIHGIP